MYNNRGMTICWEVWQAKIKELISLLEGLVGKKRV